MPRQPRHRPAGGLFHVTARGNRRQPVFLDDHDRVEFLALLARVVKDAAWRCHAYCLMDNHFHLMVETPDESLSTGMQQLSGLHAQRFNRRHELDGHLFQGRFHSVLVESDWHLLSLARYLVLNPVRAGLCTRASDWRWSSFRPTAGLAPCPRWLGVDRLLEYFGINRKEARAAYQRFIGEAELPRTRR
jgi:putative transposase